MVFPKEFFEKVDFEKNQQTTKKHEKLSSRQRVYILLKLLHLIHSVLYRELER